MALQAAYYKKIFQFNFKARTSRGLMKDKTSWFIKLWDDRNPSVYGWGECGPLPGLSPEAQPDFEMHLQQALTRVQEIPPPPGKLPSEQINNIVTGRSSSIIFAIETAWLDLMHGGVQIIFPNDFSKGRHIPINGLIWMGDLDFTMSQINEKIAQGFRCIKLKVGGLDFDRECDVLQYIRKRYFREEIVIRLDANGGFKLDDALYKLNELAKFNIHSIEQPIKPGLEEMEELCRKSPIPVAFDEELIGITDSLSKKKLLEHLKPQFIVLKPTLHGGLSGSAEWIDLAESLHIGWWITSALESNVGLNAICQFTSNYSVVLPQGLGTGKIYQNNFSSPLHVEGGDIYNDGGEWHIDLA
jgi:o-succinylbenzoate synthase